VTPTLTSLVKKIDEATEKNKAAKMGSFVVMLSDDSKLEGKLKEMAKKEDLKKIVLTIDDNQAGPDGYEIAKDADVTVILYKSKKVVKTMAFKKDELKDKDVEAAIEALNGLVK
jgi:hypothetical protein